jgi:uncharacterized repeat protein (TIGR02543 family)
LRGTLATHGEARHRAFELRRFLRKIDDAAPRELDLHLILDSAASTRQRRSARLTSASPGQRGRHADYRPASCDPEVRVDDHPRRTESPISPLEEGKMGGRFMRLVTAASLACLISCDNDTTGNEQPEQHVLLVSGTGNGTGAISTSPAGVACSYSGTTSGTCSASFVSGTVVTLTATTAGGHTFAGWSGDCAGTSTCQLTMDQGHNVTAIFTAPPPTHLLTVTGGGTGSGGITSNPSGINCTVSGGTASGTCNAPYTSGTLVTLTAAPVSGHTFAGWSGTCTGTGSCQVTMSQARTVTATFTAPLPTYQLSVAGSGTGSGSVTSTPSGISCTISGGAGSGTCSASYTSGTPVTLTAAPIGGHTFAGWSGACTGTGNCQVTISQARAVTATFTAPLPTFVLTVTGSGTGRGSVTSNPSGINCTINGGSGGGACSAPYTSGTPVTLTAAPAGGHTFAGWSGACTGTGNCQVTMSQARAVTATFTALHQLTVTGSGTGSGSVTSSPSGINCAISGGSGSGTCNAPYTSGTVVTLTAAPISGHTFAGWSGACSGTGSCQATMSQAQTVTATFNIGQQIAVPAYFPPSSSYWSGLLPYVPPAEIIVVNPNNGPGTGYTSRISDARSRGARVLGYVYTKYANTVDNPLHGGVRDRTVAAVQADIDEYYRLYPNLGGIFLDEITSDCSYVDTYYRPIFHHMRNAHPGATVVLNPGRVVESCYLGVADIVVTFEGSFTSYVNDWSSRGPTWETNAYSERIWHIVHTASPTQWKTALELSRTRSAGYVYVTSLTADENTYGALPPYFPDEAANVEAYGTTSP